jgi:hypothetical protein
MATDAITVGATRPPEIALRQAEARQSCKREAALLAAYARRYALSATAETLAYPPVGRNAEGLAYPTPLGGALFVTDDGRAPAMRRPDEPNTLPTQPST